MDKKEPQGNTSFDRLAAINRAITTSLKFDEVLRLIVVNAAELFSAEMSFLLLADDHGGVRVKASHGKQSARDFSGRMDEPVIRKLADHLRLVSPSQLVAVPVVVQGSINGFLAMVRQTQLNTEGHWQFSALADQAAIALNNARLHELQTREALRQRDESLEALRESNLRIRTILESITDLYYHLDRDFRFTDVNRRAEAVFGRNREEIIGRVLWEIFPHAAGSPLHAHLLKALEEQTSQRFEIESQMFVHKWFEVNAYPSATGVFVYLREITERKQAELATRRLAAIVESSDDAIIAKDLDGIITTWNQGAERIFGYSAEEAIGQPGTLLIPQNRFDEEPTLLEQIRRGERIDHFETVRRCKDGRFVDISLSISPIKSEAGVVIGSSKIARDITERKRAEEEIRFQAQLLNSVEQAVIASDLEGVIVYWNSFAEWLYGWSAKEVVGQNLVDIIAATGGREISNEIFARLKEGDSSSGEFLMQRKDGSVFPALITDSPIFDEAGDLIGIVGVSIDISELKRAEEERARLLDSEREARAEAEEANRLKDEFLATLSHELRNPLNVILGYSEIIQRSEEVRRSQSLQRAVRVLRRNVLAQSQLVCDLLDLSRLHMGKLALNRETVSMVTTINNAVETVRREAAAKSIRINIEANEEILFVQADPLRLEQVIWNLLNNAVKFTPQEGVITIRLRKENGEAIIEVGDTGQGIEPEFLPHVFEMFRQADASSSRRHTGMGIGLALVKQLIELQGGSVSVISPGLGKGAQFTIKLALGHEMSQSVTPAELLEPGLLTQMRILVVDDSEDTVDMLRRLFEMDGAIVSTAKSGSEGLQIVSERDFDVIVSDISMPEMDGFEFLRRLRKIPQRKDIPVLAVTGFGRQEDMEQALAEGFFSHVTKPLDINAVVKILRALPPRNSQPEVRA